MLDVETVEEVEHVEASLIECGEDQEGHQGEVLIRQGAEVHSQEGEVEEDHLDKNHRSKIERLEVIFVKDESNKSPTN